MQIIKFIPALIVAGVTAFPALAESDDAALCAEASARYAELFGHPPTEEEGVTVVTMYKYRFCPAEVTVPVGTTVRWVNVDKRNSHSVIVKESGTPESDRAFPEESIEFTFLTEGPQDILCGPHWETHDMIGRVTVTGK